MRYDVMAREALRGVVKKALKRIAREGGLPGDHHFYVTFQTQAPGVDIDPELVASYPEEITIVLEHQYWELSANEDSFEVTLKFGGVPKYLCVPYAAITKFYDPSVRFALQFDADMPAADAAKKSGAIKRGPGPKSDRKKAAEDKAETAEHTGGDNGGDVVSLDAFRRK